MTAALQRLELSRSAGDARVGDHVRYPNGDLELIVRIDRKGTFPDGRTLLWIFQDWGGGEHPGRAAYWDNETLYRRGEIVSGGVNTDNLPAPTVDEPSEKWAH